MSDCLQRHSALFSTSLKIMLCSCADTPVSLSTFHFSLLFPAAVINAYCFPYGANAPVTRWFLCRMCNPIPLDPLGSYINVHWPKPIAPLHLFIFFRAHLAPAAAAANVPPAAPATSPCQVVGPSCLQAVEEVGLLSSGRTRLMISAPSTLAHVLEDIMQVGSRCHKMLTGCFCGWAVLH